MSRRRGALARVLKADIPPAVESFKRAVNNPDTAKALGAKPTDLTTGGYAKRRRRDDWNYGDQGY